jgi:disulfide bond formation protein DsbB
VTTRTHIGLAVSLAASVFSGFGVASLTAFSGSLDVLGPAGRRSSAAPARDGDILNLEHMRVHDHETVEWVDVQNAYFVATLSVSTPMGQASLRSAMNRREQAFASRTHGEVLPWVVFLESRNRTDRGNQTMKTGKPFILVAILALALAACSGSSDSGNAATTDFVDVGPGDPAAGFDVYQRTCSRCHGGDLDGVNGLGKPLAPSAFVVDNTEAELAAFIAVGRPTSDPDNTQGVDMPPKGGNPSLDAQDLLDVSAYLKAQN